MAQPSEVSVVIPAYNEEGAIGSVVERLRARHGWKEVLVVDDGSRDATAARAEAARFLASNPDFSIRHWASTQPFRQETDRQHFVDGYLQAGLPQ